MKKYVNLQIPSEERRSRHAGRITAESATEGLTGTSHKVIFGKGIGDAGQCEQLKERRVRITNITENIGQRVN